MSARYGILEALRRDSSAAAAVEFAMVAAGFILIVMILFDLGRAFWTRATVQSVAEEVARCYAVHKPQGDASLTCSDKGKALIQAQTLAHQRGLTISSPATDIKLYDATIAAEKATADAGCGATTTMAYVTVSFRYEPILPFEMMPYDLIGRACFPIS